MSRVPLVEAITANNPRHRIAARLRFGMKPKGCGRAARAEIGRIQKLLSNHQQKLIEAWHDYFRN
jgi:hypothetical protein